MVSIQVLLVFSTICCASVKSLPFSIDVLENRDIIFPRRSDLVKRTANNDVSELSHQKISLASFIENIETGILQTALIADPLASAVHVEVQTTSTQHPVERRSTKDEASSAIESSTPSVLVKTSENVPTAVNLVPSHVVIDRVTVYKGPEDGSGLFPTFELPSTNESREATEILNFEIDDDLDSTTTDESMDSNDSSEVKDSSTTNKVVSSSTSTSSSSVVSSTTALSVEEKKSVEKQLKDKIGEVEAEPVIFTARV